jgi:hypothetical protein
MCVSAAGATPIPWVVDMDTVLESIVGGNIGCALSFNPGMLFTDLNPGADTIRFDVLGVYDSTGQVALGAPLKAGQTIYLAFQGNGSVVLRFRN